MRIAGILMALLAVCAQASAGEAAPERAEETASAKSTVADRAEADQAPTDHAFGVAVPLRQLAALRGGADTVSNDMRLSGAVSGNTALNVASGMNSISSGSFSNAAGLPVAIQNSGSNVLIQNATIINLQLQ